MSDRSRPYRRKPTEIFQQVRNQAQQSRFFVLQNIGPTSFILRDENDQKFKVCIGSKHACSCGKCGDDHCVHTMFVLIKVLRVPPDNPLCWQSSLTDSEIVDVLAAKQREADTREREAKQAERRAAMQARRDSRQNGATDVHVDKPEECERLPFAFDDTCPICCDSLLPEGDSRKEGMREHKSAMKLLTFCKAGCRRTIHSQCMKHWADHRNSVGEEISCPLCRATWPAEAMAELRRGAGLAQRKKAVFWGHTCKRCKMVPIRGTLHCCLLCDPTVGLCEDCFLHPTDPGHIRHPFVRQSAPGKCWVPACRTVHDSQVQLNRMRDDYRRRQSEAIAQIVAERELSPQDYELLRELDRPTVPDPPVAAVSAAESSEPLEEYLARSLVENEPTRVEWNRARSAGADHGPPVVVRGRVPGARSNHQAAFNEQSCVWDGCSEFGRLVRLRCGHEAHRQCIFHALRQGLGDGRSGSLAIRDDGGIAPTASWTSELLCPGCSASLLPGWAAIRRPSQQTQSGNANQPPAADIPRQTAIPSTAPSLSIIGGSLFPGDAKSQSPAQVQIRRPPRGPRRSASSGPAVQPLGPTYSRSREGSSDLAVGNGPKVAFPSDEALLRRAGMPPPLATRLRSSSANCRSRGGYNTGSGDGDSAASVGPPHDRTRASRAEGRVANRPRRDSPAVSIDLCVHSNSNSNRGSPAPLLRSGVG